MVFGAEARLQEEIVSYAKAAYPLLVPLLFYVNNNSSSARLGARNKRLGLTKGIFDLIGLVANPPYCGFCIEVKSEKGRLTPEQKTFQEAVNKQGFSTFVAFTFAEAKSFIDSYMGSAAAKNSHQSERILELF